MGFLDFFKKKKPAPAKTPRKSSMFSGYRLVATLDTETCIICGSLDGKVFKSEEEAKSHECLNEDCRCMIIPEIKGMEGFDDDDTRASMDGQVPAKTTFSKWLKKQPAARKKEILGEYYKQYKEGLSLEEISKIVETKPDIC